MTNGPTLLAPYGVPELSDLATQHASLPSGSPAKPQKQRDPADIEAERILWQRHIDARDPEAREQLIIRFMPYAKIVAAGLYAKHTRHETDFDEYVQWATLGMIEAIDRYDINRGAQFKTYALTRMQGSIRDGLATISERQQQISLQRRLMAERLAEIKKNASLALDSRLLESLSEIGVGVALSLMLDDTGMLLTDEQTLPDHCYAALELKQMRERIHQLLAQLTTREQSVIKLHYLQGLAFEDVAKTLGVTKGRISQLHEQGLGRLLKMLSQAPRQDIFL